MKLKTAWRAPSSVGARLGIVAGLAVLCSACTHNDFGPGTAQALVAQKPRRLDAEQLILSYGQVDCGVREQLWDPPAELGSRTLARLTERGRTLKFDDDVVVAEAGHRNPYVQVRGDFPLTMPDPPDVKDQGDMKMAVGKVLAMVDHSCFPDPVPVMGVRHGNFAENAVPVLRFEKTEDGWAYAGLVH
jgi:hypothetical protein